MGYACPVCEDPQADGGHLANHLAFTALTGGDDHEAWLDAHVGEWSQLGETELAELVVEEAEQTEFPQVFDESGVESDGHDHPAMDDIDSHTDPELSDEDAAVLSEARDLTKEMLADDRSDEGETE